MPAAWHARWPTIWRKRRTGFEGVTSSHVSGNLHADRRKRRPWWGPARGKGGAADGRDSGGSRVVRGRRHRQGAGRIPGDGRDQHALPRHVHLRSRHRRPAAAWPAAPRSRQAGIRRQFPRRQLCDAPSAVLPPHEHRPREGARSSQLRRDRRRAPGGAPPRHEGDLLVRGRVPARRAGLRPGGGDRPPRQADRPHLPPQSQRAQLLARARRGLPAVLRRGRPDVGERAPGPARQRPGREPRQLERGRRDRLLLPPLSRCRASARDQHRARAGRLSGTRALGRGAARGAATRRRRVRDVLAPAGQVSGAARVGATVERGAQRRLPGPASAREECRPGEGCRLGNTFETSMRRCSRT